MNKKLIILFFLFFAQVYLYIDGARVFSYWVNPILFFGVSLLLFLVYFKSGNLIPKEKTEGTTKEKLWIFGAIGCFVLLASYEELRKIFVAYPLPTPNSDVIIQLETLYSRWVSGIYPYQFVHLNTHSPFPVYMPLHWMPMGLAMEFGLDSRWSGLFVYFLCSLIYIALLLHKNMAWWANLAIALVPGVLLWIHVIFLAEDIAVSPEYLIAGYYLVLSAGLLSKRMLWTTIGVILCLLSRYTFVFWLPVLFFYALKSFGWQKTTGAIIALFTAVFCIYIYPFLLNHSTILQQGVTYHNICAIAELSPRQNQPMGWSYSYGLHSALYYRTIFSSMDSMQLVYVIRMVQALAMLFVCTLALFFLKSKRYRFSKFSLAFLYLQVLVFFTLSPLSYRYYYFTLLALSISLLVEGLLKRDNTLF